MMRRFMAGLCLSLLAFGGAHAEEWKNIRTGKSFNVPAFLNISEVVPGQSYSIWNKDEGYLVGQMQLMRERIDDIAYFLDERVENIKTDLVAPQLDQSWSSYPLGKETAYHLSFRAMPDNLGADVMVNYDMRLVATDTFYCQIMVHDYTGDVSQPEATPEEKSQLEKFSDSFLKTCLSDAEIHSLPIVATWKNPLSDKTINIAPNWEGIEAPKSPKQFPPRQQKLMVYFNNGQSANLNLMVYDKKFNRDNSLSSHIIQALVDKTTTQKEIAGHKVEIVKGCGKAGYRCNEIWRFATDQYQVDIDLSQNKGQSVSNDSMALIQALVESMDKE